MAHGICTSSSVRALGSLISTRVNETRQKRTIGGEQTITSRWLPVCRQSYDVTIDLKVDSTGMTCSNTLDLKNPYFRYAGQPAQPPPGHSTTSPSEAYWSQLDVQGARQGLHDLGASPPTSYHFFLIKNRNDK